MLRDRLQAPGAPDAERSAVAQQRLEHLRRRVVARQARAAWRGAVLRRLEILLPWLGTGG